MALNCNFGVVNTNKFKALQALEDYCGTNITQFAEYVYFVIDRFEGNKAIPTDDFAKWYTDNYKSELDFNAGEGVRMKNAILKYYTERLPSVNGNSKRNNRTNNAVMYRYSSASARNFAKRFTARLILDMHSRLNYVIQHSDRSSYEEIQKEKAELIALDIIEASSLSEEKKTEIFDKILNEAVTETDVRKVLAQNKLNARFDINSKNKTYYFNKAQTILTEELANRIFVRTNLTFDEINAKLDEHIENGGVRGWIEEQLGGKNISLQDANMLALFDEFALNKEAFIEEVCLNSDLAEFRFEDQEAILDTNETDSTNTELDNDETRDEDDESAVTNDDDVDVSVAIFDHSGIFTTALMHINPNLKSYFNSLRKLNSKELLNREVDEDGNVSGDPDYDKNNPLGVYDTMNANECASILYHYGDYTSVESMINSIEDIADRIPGFKAFYTLAQDLKSNEDFAFELYRVFGKMVIGKTVTVVKDGKGGFTLVNRRNNKQESFRLELLNSVKTTVINNNVSFLRKEFDNITKVLESTDRKATIRSDKNSSARKNIINQIYSLLKMYYGTIDPLAIENYINLNRNEKGEIDVIRNINNLVDIIRTTLDGAEDSQALYNEFEKERRNAADNNYKINRLVDVILERDTTGKLNEDSVRYNLATKGYSYVKEQITDENLRKRYYLDNYEIATLESVYVKPYLSSKSLDAVTRLGKELVNYSLVKVELNTANVHNNQSSDVINSSTLTTMINTLKDEIVLKKYGDSRAQSKQYQFSHILWEYTDPNTRETIHGLFRKDANGNVTVTEYAQELLKITLFDGARSRDNGNVALYKEMGKADYIGTAFLNYYTQDQNTKKGAIRLATYFMRTPSDAPRNFLIQAPRYSTANLFTIANKGEINSAMAQERAKVLSKSISQDDAKDYKQGGHVALDRTIVTSRVDSFIRHATREDGFTTKLPDWVKTPLKNKVGDKVTIRFQYKTENTGKDDNIYTITGIYGDGKLTECHFDGIVNSKVSTSVYDAIDDATRTKLDREGIEATINGEIKLVKTIREINPNNILFKILKRRFRQEILDAAIALDKFFETWPNGLVKRYTEADAAEARKKGLNVQEGDIIWKEGISHNGREVVGAYDNYHHKKGVIVKHNEETGRDELVGNVFKSNIFTVFDEETEKDINFGNDLINQLFDFLYGGRDNNFIQVIKDGDGPNARVVDVNLQNADDAINNMISQFILKYTESAVQRLEQFEDALPVVDLSFDTVSDFVLNYHVAYLGFDDLFEGNSKFYKDSQTFLKRAKEVQGSGTPYGVLDFRTLFEDERKAIPHRLNSITFAGGHKVEMYNKFRAVTVVNTVKTGETIGEFKRNGNGEFIKNERGHVEFIRKGALANKLIKIFVAEGYSDITAEDKAADLLSGYADTTVNDAQSYITFEEWIRRVTARGQLPKYQPLIEKIYAGEELTADELTEFVQVQKNFYYDLHYDAEAGLFAPRQIKNAEFVLIPQFIQGTQLEAVEKMMKKYGIDQLNTEEASKAGKTNTLEIFDAKTGDVKKDILDELYGNATGDTPISLFGQQAKSSIQLYDYGFLYTQQETPQHVNSKNKAAIQIMKKIVDNIPNDPKHPLYDVKKRFFSLYCANIRDSFDSFMDELGVEKDEEGNIKLDETGYPIGLNKDVFYERLKEELMRRGLDSNALDYVYRDATQMLKDGTERIMPEYVSMYAQKLENVAQAIFNSRITRQKLNGFHAAQISNNGFKPLSDKVTKRSYSNDLRYHPDGEPYIEIMVPASFFGFARYDGKGNLKDKETLLKELQDAKLDEIIGYRIPTEGKQSIAIMKVVGFLDDSQGSTIVVPNDWVAQTGSDFDIDSVYGIQFATGLDANSHIRKIGYSKVAGKSYEKYIQSQMSDEERKEILNNKDFSYDSYGVINNLQSRDEFSENNPNLVVLDNSREARNNELVECMLTILRHADMLEENLSRSNFKDVTDALSFMMPSVVKKRRNSRSSYNFLDQADYQEDAMSGAKLKAFSVTRDTFCSVCNTVRPVLKSTHTITVAYAKSLISKEDAIKRFGEENVKVKGDKVLITHNRLGWSLDNKNVVDKILTAYSSQTTAHILDAIKEGSVPNVNDLTFAVYKLFPDLGIDYETGIGFILQNGVKRIVDNYNRTKSVYTSNSSKPIIQAIRDIAIELGYDPYEFGATENLLAELQSKHGDKFSELFGADVKISLENDNLSKFVLDKDILKKRLEHPLTDTDGLLYDLGIILQYAKFDRTAQNISKYTRVCNPDKFGAKQSIYATNKIFEDIEDIVVNEDNDAFDTSDGTFIDKIYPGLIGRTDDGTVLGIDINKFVKSSPEESKYPSLYYFLKYSTAPSVVINRQIFKTEDPAFRALIKRLESYLPNGRRITEKEYNDFKKYIISALYNQCESITLPIGYNNDGFVVAMPNDVSPLEKEDYKQQERDRVFGYGVNPMAKMTVIEDGVEKEVPFTVDNLAHPTPQDIERFIKLTPAQKVAFIQKNFRDIGIFGVLQSSVFNDKTIAGKKAGSQTIRFVDTNRNIEDCFVEFEEAFNSNNPLVALAAYDLVKYAFLVEGYKMSKSGISKIIPNAVLYNDFGKFGTGFITELKDKMNNIATTFPSSPIPEEDAAGLLCEKFVRAHADNLKISEKRVRTNSKGYLDLSRHNGIVYIKINTPDSRKTAINYGLVYESKNAGAVYANSFVKLRFPKEDDYTLYKIVRETNGTDDMIYAYPISRLEENESSDVSANPNNNVSYTEEYYKSILDSYFAKYKEFTPEHFKELVSTIDKKDFKIKAPKEFTYDDSIDFSLENPPLDLLGTVSYLIESVDTQFGNLELDIKGHYGFIMSPGLAKYIRRPGDKYKLTKPFVVNRGTKNERFLNLDIIKLDYNAINDIIKPYLQDKEKEIAKGHEDYKYIIERLRLDGIVDPQDPIFVLKPNVSGIRSSRIKEHKVTSTTIASDLYSFITSRSKSGNIDDRAKKATRRFRRKNINRSLSSVRENENEILRSGAQYVVERAEEIMTKLRYFVADPSSDGYLSVTDPEVIPLLAENEDLRNEFLEQINDAEALVKSNRHIFELDIKSQDSEMQNYLTKIKTVISDLQNNSILNDAKVLFANDFLGKLSKNPIIRQDIINILDGYYSTNSMNAMFSDLQETSNPFVQVLTKHVMSDISAKDAAAKKAARAWIKKWEDIHRRAQAAGKPINISHVIDDYGRFVQKYNSKLNDDLKEKRAELDELKTIAETTTGVLESHKAWLEYFKAQLAYDEWIVDHINQPVLDEYYRRKIALDKQMLYGNKDDFGFMNDSEGHPIVFVKYKQLELKRREIINHEIQGVLEEDLEKQLEEIDKEIANLTSPLYYDATTGELTDREVYDEFFNPITGTPEEQYQKSLYSKTSQQAILDYTSRMATINEDYFEYDEVFGFEEELKRNLHIINSKELRDPQGHITQPMDLLLEDEQYRQAKEWVARNAKFILKDNDREKLNQAFKTLGSRDTRLRFKQFAKEANAYDSKETIDGRKFTDAQIAEIKREQELQYGVLDQGGTSDKSVIGIRVGKPVIYTDKFTSGLKSNSVKNSEYLAIVKKINDILRNYYDEGTGTINWSKIPNNKEGYEIYRKLGLLFSELQETKTGTDKERAKEIAEFIEKYVDTELSEEEQKEFDVQETIARGLGKAYYDKWCLANYMIIDGERKPNRYIYHKLRPKKEFENEFINKEKTEALRLIEQTYDTVPTEYYYQKIEEVKKEGRDAFNKWYYDNHIYNPNTGHYEPIRCWTTLSYKDTSKEAGDWVPKGPQTSKSIKKDYRNPAYKEDSGHLLNYKEGTGYDNPIIGEQTEFETELKEEMESILYELALSDADKRFIDSGYAPARRKGEKVDGKFVGKEILKTLGWVTSHTGTSAFYDDIDYGKDKTVSIPMLKLFDQKKAKDLKLVKPEKLENETDAQFSERLKKYEDDINELKENNRKAHAEALDKNWKEAFYDYIIQAGHLQAIQDNKQMLFYGKSIIDNYEVYQKQYGFFGDYKFDSRTSDEENPDYLMKKDKNLSEQYDNWVRRLVYNQWKQSNERYTKWASRLQSITSAQYMMMNIRGGIANVTLGATQIIAEAWARDFFNFSEWAKSDVFYMSAIPSFATHMYREDSSSLADAIVKFFNVVDYDENTGRSRVVEEPTMKAFSRFRAAMYSPQTIGEHYMQNRALFAMLMSHRLYVENNPITGKEELVFKNEGEVLQGADEEALMSVLSEELKVKFKEMKEQISNDPNKAKDFAHFRQDLINVFVKQYLGKDGNKQAVKDYIKARKLLQEKRLNEFKNDKSHPTLMSQLDLDSEGYMGYKKDSLLAQYDVKTTGKKVTNADQLLADFRGRVISVNKKIHGVYDKMGQAQIEKYWFGSLVMQYHKHIPIGIAKRWKKEGSFNESRGTIEKGSYVSLYDFLATPWKNYKNKLNLTEGEVNALTGVQNILKDIAEFLTNIGIYWNILPEYEKNNIRRNLGDVCGVLAALFATVALKALADDDDEESILWNLALYEADRLGSETIQFNPWGFISEAKKLWSTPIAAQSGIEDLWQSMGLLTKMITEGSDFDPYYHSGRFAGEHKLSVYIQRRIPIWRGIKTGFIDIVESNNYYKLSDNFNSKFADSILTIVEDD